MRIPGFTAETSLGRERGRQYVTRSVDQTVLAIQPAQIFLPPVDIVSCPTACGTCSCLRFFGSGGCVASCNNGTLACDCIGITVPVELQS
jgi:hypothetical protein